MISCFLLISYLLYTNVETLDFTELSKEDLSKYIKDKIVIFDWVPCSSCMHPAFDKKYEIINKIVVYEHKNFPIMNLNLDFPKMKNGDFFEDIIEFLASAELVITNSYHGAYWATLLGRRVLVIQPFSTKFLSFKHPLVVANSFDLKDVNNIPVYPEALNDARNANILFADKVIALMRKE